MNISHGVTKFKKYFRWQNERGNAMHQKKWRTGLLLALGFGICLSISNPGGPARSVYGAAPDTRSEAVRYWRIGDTVVRNIDGKPYRFRCIDQNYADHMDDHSGGALFLCDTVIPADTGSEYRFETPDDAAHDYVFYPGPITRFGMSADYKYSAVRRWLRQSEAEFSDAKAVNTGVGRTYRGSTQEGMWEQFPGDELTPQYPGSQKMTDRLFILSVDEAYRYRKWLWCFDGAAERNPESQISEFCKGYWLRTPCGNADGKQVYIVDLVNGAIRPEAVQVERNKAGEKEKESGMGDTGKAEQGGAGRTAEPETGYAEKTEKREMRKTTGEEELEVTGTTGVRPVFVLPQKSV